MRARAALALAAVAASVVAVAPAASAADPAALVTSFDVVGEGPDDLVVLTGTGFTPGAAASVTLVGLTASRPLTTVTVDASGGVNLPAGIRTPTNLARDTYQLVVDDGVGGVAASPSFAVAAPRTEAPQYVRPGQQLRFPLAGAGAGPLVRRTVAVDGTTLAATSYESTADGVGVEVVLPGSLASGHHTVRITQNRNPAFTLATAFDIDPPGLSVFGEDGTTSPIGTSTRVNVYGYQFGDVADVALVVVDAGGRRSVLPDLGANSQATFRLPTLAVGRAVLTATNRRNGETASADVVVGAASVTAPAGLAPGAVLTSPNGHIRLTMRTDGNLVLSRDWTTRWSSVTSRYPGARTVFQPDGSLAVVLPDHPPVPPVLWSNRTPTADRPTRLVVQDDGNAVVYSSKGRAVWSTRTAGGDQATLAAGSWLGPDGQLLASNGAYRLTMQTDGNAALIRGDDGVRLFSTRTNGRVGASLTLQTDGNLVVYSSTGAALWANRVFPGPGARLVMQGDGNLVEYAANGRAVWSSGTEERGVTPH